VLVRVVGVDPKHHFTWAPHHTYVSLTFPPRPYLSLLNIPHTRPTHTTHTDIHTTARAEQLPAGGAEAADRGDLAGAAGAGASANDGAHARPG
jgi:hypothetical protein